MLITITTKKHATEEAKGYMYTSRLRYDRGKYIGAPGDFVGRTVETAAKDVIAIYPERRKDAEGPYVALCCIVSRAGNTKLH